MKGQNDPLTGTVLEGIDFQSFIGKSVEEFLTASNATYIDDAPFNPEFGQLAGWSFWYDEKFYIIISVFEYNHLPDIKYNRDGNYDFELFKKEKIGYILVTHRPRGIQLYFDDRTRQ